MTDYTREFQAMGNVNHILEDLQSNKKKKLYSVQRAAPGMSLAGIMFGYFVFAFLYAPVIQGDPLQEQGINISLTIKDQCWFYKSEEPVLICVVNPYAVVMHWRRNGDFVVMGGSPVGHDKSNYNITALAKHTSRQEHLWITSQFAISLVNNQSVFRCESQGYTSPNLYLHIPDCELCKNCSTANDNKEIPETNKQVELAVEDPCWFYKAGGPVLRCTAHSEDRTIHWITDPPVGYVLLENNITKYADGTWTQERLHLPREVAISAVKDQTAFRCENQGYNSPSISLPNPVRSTCADTVVKLKDEDLCWFYKSTDPVLICTVQSKNQDIFWRQNDLAIGLETQKYLYNILGSYSNGTVRQERLQVARSIAISSVNEESKFRCENRDISSSDVYLKIPDCHRCGNCSAGAEARDTVTSELHMLSSSDNFKNHWPWIVGGLSLAGAIIFAFAVIVMFKYCCTGLKANTGTAYMPTRTTDSDNRPQNTPEQAETTA